MNEPKTTSVYKGIGVSPGIVSGRAFVLNHQDMAAPSYHLVKASQVAEEIRRFRKALKSAEQELAGIREKMASREGIESRFIDVHTLILKDRSYRRDTVNFIREKRINAEWALRLTLPQVPGRFHARWRTNISGADRRRGKTVTHGFLRNLSAGKPDSISESGGVHRHLPGPGPSADTVHMSPDTVLRVCHGHGGQDLPHGHRGPIHGDPRRRRIAGDYRERPERGHGDHRRHGGGGDRQSRPGGPETVRRQEKALPGHERALSPRRPSPGGAPGRPHRPHSAPTSSSSRRSPPFSPTARTRRGPVQDRVHSTSTGTAFPRRRSTSRTTGGSWKIRGSSGAPSGLSTSAGTSSSPTPALRRR